MIKNTKLSVQNKVQRILLFGALIIFPLAFLQEAAFAVPTFSRKYQTSCMTCHVGFPKLNAFGEAFKNQGYRLPDDEVFVKEPPVWLGSEAYERVWPNAIWPTTIPGNVPIALRIEGEFDYNPANSTAGGSGKSNFEFPHEIEFLSMGTLGKNLAYHLAVALQDEDERTAVENVWLEYNDVLAGTWGVPEDLFNMRFGLIEPMAIPFSQHTQRLATSRPAITDFRISSGDQPRMRDSQSGIEVYGIINKRLRYVTGVVNGDAESANSDAFVDNNTEKDIYGRFEYKFGGLPFSGAAESGASSEELPSLTYFDQGRSVTVGTSGYWGVNQVDAATDTDSEYYRITSFVRLTYDRHNLDAAYLYQHDDAAAGQFNGTIDDDVESNGFYMEATTFFKPWIAFLARYDNLSIDHVSVLGASNPRNNTSRMALSLPVYPRPNLRIVPEASFGLTADRDANAADSYKIRLDFAY